MVDITYLLKLLVAAATLATCLFLIPWLKSKTTAEQREHMLKWVEIAVAAAQQMFYSLDGEKRLAYALSILEEKGFNINDEALLDAVEAAVLKLHQAMKDETLHDTTPPVWAQEAGVSNDG